jgi:hypothetical protein
MATLRRLALLASIIVVVGIALALNAFAVTSVNTDLAAHQPIADLIRSSSDMRVYEGLPHPIWDGEHFETELKSKFHFERYGFHFYPNAVNVEPDDAARVTRILSDSASFEEHTEEHLCGGFHPDCGIEYRSDNETVFVQICLGCGEIKFFTSSRQLHADIVYSRHNELRQLFKPYLPQWPSDE